MQQIVLAQFMRQGHFGNHIRRMRQVYGERRRVLIDEIGQRLGPAVSVQGGDAGLHLVLGLPPGTDDDAIARQARKLGVLTRPLSLYSLRPDPARGLVLGYGAVTEQEIRHSFGLLAEVIAPHLP
jgi:GntR family transcriptional regulator/MocR family aminotransferase